jgi:hypothetical protein
MISQLQVEKIINDQFERCRRLLDVIIKDSNNNEVMVETSLIFFNYDKFL